MPLAILTLLSGLLISGVAIFYSVAGLTNIFAAAVVPIIIMGTSLEVAKLVATVWLKQNWKIAPVLLRAYLLIAVVVLMAITSMGIFGYLSKAHSDQTLISGDVQSRIAIYDQKIQTARENIDANRKALQQMDAAVDQTLGRTTDEKGALNAVSIRRSQSRERNRLNTEIQTDQEEIAKLNEEAAPIRAEIRKVEAEVGPIKYIAALIYGEEASNNMLEDAVRWVIILIVIVFDPLAVTLLLASQYSFTHIAEQKRRRQEDEFVEAFEAVKGTVPPEINLEYDDEVSESDDDPEEDEVEKKEVSARLIAAIKASMENEARLEETKQPVAAQPTSEGNDVIDPERVVSETRIIHTPNGMIIEDAAGTQSIPTQPEIIAIDKDYVSVDGQVFHHKAYQPTSTNAQNVVDAQPATYVQNEEQQESNKWSNVLGTITEDRYLEAAQRRQQEDNK